MSPHTRTVNIHEAKTHLCRLLNEVIAGKVVIIAKAGKPMARLIPIKAEKRRRKPGLLKGQLTIAANFHAPLPRDIQREFDGKT
ncbi:type II toxin-antitoxin system Phd/YefM family antitoxin [Nitrospira sp. Nam74]